MFNGLRSKASRKFPVELHHAAQIRLSYLHYAASLQDLMAPPSNQLESLKGNFKGFYSIRINKQWRIIFRWKDGQAEEVQIIDYH